MPNPVAFDADTHTYTHPTTGRRYRSVTGVLARLGLIGADWYTDAARDRGSRVHRASVDRAAPLLPGDQGYLDALFAFEAQAGLEPILVETPLADPLYDVAGMPDRIGYLARLPAASTVTRRLRLTMAAAPTRRWLSIVDYKTGGPEPWHPIQLGGYHHLALVNAIGGSPAQAYPVLPVAVYLHADGTFTPRVVPTRTREFLILASAAAIVDAAQNGGLA